MVQRRFFFSLAAAAALGACSASPPVRASAGSLIDVQIVDRHSGHVLPEYRHRGQHWVAGRPGDRYAVRMTNRSGSRVLVVLSVDGINAISGQTAGTSQTGYVLAPWESADITGWRKSDSQTAAFYFTALPDSYAARTERPHNVGVIGVAAFRERVPQPLPYPRTRPVPFGAAGEGRSDSAAAGASADSGPRKSAESAAAAAPSPSPSPPALSQAERLGTGHGEREYAPIERTSFERATSYPAEIVQLRYDSHANLVASGVITHHRRAGGPDPFPGYVPDPRW